MVTPMKPSRSAMKRSCASLLLRGWAFSAGRKAVRVGHPLFGGEDGVLARFGPDVGQVAQDAEPVHLGEHIAAEVGEAAVAAS